MNAEIGSRQQVYTIASDLQSKDKEMISVRFPSLSPQSHTRFSTLGIGFCP